MSCTYYVMDLPQGLPGVRALPENIPSTLGKTRKKHHFHDFVESEYSEIIWNLTVPVQLALSTVITDKQVSLYMSALYTVHKVVIDVAIVLAEEYY